MNRSQVIEAQPNQFAWVMSVNSKNGSTAVEKSRWPVLAWSITETHEAVLVQPVLPDGLHLGKHAIGLESSSGQVACDGQLFDSPDALAAALLADHEEHEWLC